MALKSTGLLLFIGHLIFLEINVYNNRYCNNLRCNTMHAGVFNLILMALTSVIGV